MSSAGGYEVYECSRLSPRPVQLRPWIGPVCIGPDVTSLKTEDQKNYEAHKRNEADKQPPSASSKVMKPSNGNSQSWQKQDESEKTANN